MARVSLRSSSILFAGAAIVLPLGFLLFQEWRLIQAAQAHGWVCGMAELATFAVSAFLALLLSLIAVILNSIAFFRSATLGSAKRQAELGALVLLCLTPLSYLIYFVHYYS